MIPELSKIKGPLLLIAVLLFSLFFGAYVPVSVKSTTYAISLGIKEVLIFMLPFLIFSFVFGSMVSLQKKAFRFILLIVPLVCLSSYICVWLAYFSGSIFIPKSTSIASALGASEGLAASFAFALPKLISNDLALLLGLILGLIGSFKFPHQAEKISSKIMAISHWILNKIFVPIMPLFILGFTLKLEHDQVLQVLCQNYLLIFVIIFCSAFGFLFLVYAALSGFRPNRLFYLLKNMSSAILAGFSTMSSAAAMPLTILAAEKNTARPEIASSVVPATVNIHLVGDCFATPIFALAILISFGLGVPDPLTYAWFALYFVLAKFAVAGVPGGGILVMLPVLEQHLGFSGEMLSLITALYIIFDPIITSANVSGNGAFAIVFTKVFDAIGRIGHRKAQIQNLES